MLKYTIQHQLTEICIYWLKLLSYDYGKCENVTTNIRINSYNQICETFIMFKNAVQRVIRYNGIYQEGDWVIKKPEGQNF